MKNTFKHIILFGIVVAFSGCASRPQVQRSLSTTSWGYRHVSYPEPVRAGEKSQRFEVRKGDCAGDSGWNDCSMDRERSEVEITKSIYPESDMWFSWSFFIPEDYKPSSKVTTTIGQIHQRGVVLPGQISTAHGMASFPPLLQFDTVGNIFGTTYHKISRNSSTVADWGEFEPITTVAKLRGKWTDVVVHFKPTKENGTLEIFINGKLERTVDNPMLVKPDNFYLKYGVYRSFVSKEKDAGVPTQIVYFDEVRIGKTRLEVDAQLNSELQPVD